VLTGDSESHDLQENFMPSKSIDPREALQNAHILFNAPIFPLQDNYRI